MACRNNPEDTASSIDDVFRTSANGRGPSFDYRAQVEASGRVERPEARVSVVQNNQRMRPWREVTHLYYLAIIRELIGNAQQFFVARDQLFAENRHPLPVYSQKLARDVTLRTWRRRRIQDLHGEKKW